jgi:hypothetical protein
MKRLAATFGAVIAMALAASCVPRDWSDAAARDRIMLVRESPETLGFLRLTRQAAARPDFERFLRRRGRPDFIAETASDDRRYMVLYYLEERRAYAVRTWTGPAASIDFAGPYAMTDKETGLLSEMKAKSIHQAESGVGRGRLLVP